MNIVTLKVRSDDLQTLIDVLDLEEEAFSDAMHNDTMEPAKGWEELLGRAGSYSEILASIGRIKEAVEDGQPD